MKLIGITSGLLFLWASCAPDQPVNQYRILGNIEDPQNEIAQQIAKLVNANSSVHLLVTQGIGTLSNLDSLEKGKADFAIVDNYSRFSDEVKTVLPMYPQVLHILKKKSKKVHTLEELLTSSKIFAGLEGSGTRQFVESLINDLQIETKSYRFVDVYNYFEADVIFAFTDLLSFEELRDLKDYTLVGLDGIDNLGKGSYVEAVCLRHPQFEPYIIPKSVYGNFTNEPILTVKEDALLVCRADVSDQTVDTMIRVLLEHSQNIKIINPLLYQLSADFNPKKLSFAMHDGLRAFLERDKPSFFEQHADTFSVLISIFVAIASAIFSIVQWKKQKKKDKIDMYYQKLVMIRKRIPSSQSAEAIAALKLELNMVQEETIDLVTREKLLADETFLIFLNLYRIIKEELDQALTPYL